jgi:TetR/AcrR family fatty acid metabolism transcriptional regulator
VRTKTPVQAEKILTVAARFFASHRFHEARMDDIAAAAGVGKGTLYRYFKDKEELYLALLDRAAEQLPRRLNEAEDPALGPRQRLEAMVGALFTYFDEQPHLFDLIQHAEVTGAMDRDLSWHNTRQNTLDRFEAVLSEGEQAGLFQVPDLRVAVLLLLGGIRSVLRFGDKAQPADLARRLTDIFVRGIAASACGKGKGPQNAN